MLNLHQKLPYSVSYRYNLVDPMNKRKEIEYDIYAILPNAAVQHYNVSPNKTDPKAYSCAK